MAERLALNQEAEGSLPSEPTKIIIMRMCNGGSVGGGRSFHDSIVVESGPYCPLCDALLRINQFESDNAELISDKQALEDKIDELMDRLSRKDADIAEADNKVYVLENKIEDLKEEVENWRAYNDAETQ